MMSGDNAEPGGTNASPDAGEDRPVPARRRAAAIVRRWLETQEFPDRLVDGVERDRAAVMEIVYGTVKFRRELEFLVRQAVKRMPDRALRAYLLTGVYQLWHTGEAAYAVVNETVSAARDAFGERQAGFVNAVLRTVLRRGDALRELLASQPAGVRFSHPDLLLQRWIARYGEAETRRLCEWDNRPAPMTLRLDTARVSPAAFIEASGSLGVEAAAHPFAPARYVGLARGCDVRRLPGYEAGHFIVQDPSTSVAVELLAPYPGERLLDGCAAPGGKTVAIAERMGGEGRLVAVERHADRIPALKETLARTRHTGVDVREADLSTVQPDDLGLFDGVLLDVPCSNTGVLRRRPDARWRFSEERLGRLVATQTALLGAAAALVRPGGRMVFSTCSLEAEEGETLVRSWVASVPQFALEAERRVTPFADGVDGAYAARLVRKS